MFASVYDKMGADEHSIRMVEYTGRILRRFRIHPATCLDLCCGTGTAIERLLDFGLDMSGLDRSKEMLAIAAKKLRGNKVTLYRKELPKFRIPLGSRADKCVTFDLITCYYDSLNYLRNLTELKTAFRSVRSHLKPGGWFIFDMNTPEALKILWSGQVYADSREDLAWIWKNEYFPKAKSAFLHTTFFVRKGKLWEKFEEHHYERAYSNALIRKQLLLVGFQVKGFYRCFSFERARAADYRICVVVRRPSR
ncbi:MAG: class I SAM-dependent DNA methyltransferase [Candidatus Zixiibacteriota bacterium]